VRLRGVGADAVETVSAGGEVAGLVEDARQIEHVSASFAASSTIHSSTGCSPSADIALENDRRSSVIQ